MRQRMLRGMVDCQHVILINRVRTEYVSLSLCFHLLIHQKHMVDTAAFDRTVQNHKMYQKYRSADLHGTKNLVGVYWTVAGVINNPRHRTGFSDLIREISKFVSWQLDQDNVSCTVTAWLSCKLHSHRYPANISAIRHWCVSVCTYIITYIGRYAKTLVVYKHWFFDYCIW